LAEDLGVAFDIDYLGMTPYGVMPAAPAASPKFRLHLLPCRSPLSLSPGRANLDAHLARLRPAAVLVSGPPAMVDFTLRCLQPHRPATRVILYMPIEGELAAPGVLSTIALADACILYTEHARKNVRALHARAPVRDPPIRLPPLFVLGHGVDCAAFAPLGGSVDGHFGDAGRAAARALLFPDNAALRRGFIVLNANRAYYRKRLDLTIAGFARFASGKPDAFLYLHVPGVDPAERKSLDAAAAAAGIAQRVLINAVNPDGATLPRQTLNLLYNACDVGLTTAMGEGWGLGSFEHAATGAPQIVPDHTAFAENWRDAALLVPITGRQFLFYEFADMFEVSPDGVAQALESLHADAEYRRRMAHAAYARANEPRHRWPNLARRLGDLLDGIIAAEPPRDILSP
jgi:D-inositol-3-phosphate glycosyltransferase